MGERMNTLLFKRSARLFAKPSFMEGFARAIDIGATLNEYKRNVTEAKADYEALKSDWYAVGDSIYEAIESYRI
jgi:hypothetical protein